MKIEHVSIDQIRPYAKNPRRNDQAVDRVAQSIQEFGFNQPIVVDQEGTIVVGHTRFKAAKRLKLTQVPVLRLTEVSQDKIQAYRIADNRLNELAEWDDELLLEELQDIVSKLGDADLTGFDIDDLLEQARRKSEDWLTLNQKYLYPPFSIIDGRSRDWLDRKRVWKDMGIRSEQGRSDGLTYPSEGFLSVAGASTSVFDPVLTELLYLWFSPLNGSILDPFAGGSVRGIVANILGRHYTGIDLRAEQITANQQNWQDLQAQGKKTLARYDTKQPLTLQWIQGDSNDMLDHLDQSYDLVFTCPPYADLEVYSDDPKDISNMPYDQFMVIYRSIIRKAAARLRDNRFFVVVVGEVRGKDGSYYNFVGDTITACVDAGLAYYNEAVFITPNGSLSMRAERPFKSGRKLGKHHQNAMVFVKGSGQRAREDIDAISAAWDYNDATGTLAERHEKVLMFIKGDAKKATKDLGEVDVDSLASIDQIDLQEQERVADNLAHLLEINHGR